MYIYGSECTITLDQNNILTPLPYTIETLREERNDSLLDPLIGDLTQTRYIPGETEISGCIITRICLSSVYPLAILISIHKKMTLYLNRIVEKRIYANVALTGYELRAERDNPLYLRFDIHGTEATDWVHATPDIPWVSNETLTFEDGNINIDGGSSTNIYQFVLTRSYDDSIQTLLQIHYPLLNDDSLNNARYFNTVVLTFSEKLRFTLIDLVLRSFQANTDNADEILVIRQFRVDGDVLIEIRNPKGEWVRPV